MSRSARATTAAFLALLAFNAWPVGAREDGRRLRLEMRRQMRMNLDPGTLLQSVYANYIMLKRCHEARQENLATFLDPAEWARADGEARSLRERIKTLAPAVPDGLAWQLASNQAGPLSQNTQNCRGALAALDNLYEDLSGAR